MSAPETLGVAIAQFAPTADKRANLQTIRDFTERAAARGAQLVVFPEYSSHFSTPLGPNALAAAESLDGAFASGLAQIAAQFRVHLVAGIVEASDQEHYFNTLVAFDGQGTRVAVYRKLHLYDAFGAHESEWMRAGAIEHPQTFELGGFTVGLQTCYDLRFPEVTRWLVDAGVDLVLVPAEWVPGPAKERHWTTLLQARAIENTVYVVAADHTAPGGVGLSAIIDPMGVSVASIGREADVAIAQLSTELLSAVRAQNPALALRRFTVVPKRGTEEASAGFATD